LGEGVEILKKDTFFDTLLIKNTSFFQFIYCCTYY